VGAENGPQCRWPLFRDMLAKPTSPPARQSPCSVIPEKEMAIELGISVLSFLDSHIKGQSTGREMYGSPVQEMTVMLQSGLDISPSIPHRFGPTK